MTKESKDSLQQPYKSSREASVVIESNHKENTNTIPVEKTALNGTNKRTRTRTRVQVQTNMPTFALRDEKNGEQTVRGSISPDQVITDSPFNNLSTVQEEKGLISPTFRDKTKHLIDNLEKSKKSLPNSTFQERDSYSSIKDQFSHSANLNNRPKNHSNRSHSYNSRLEDNSYCTETNQAIKTHRSSGYNHKIDRNTIHTQRNKRSQHKPKKQTIQIQPRPDFIPTYPDEKEGSNEPIRLNKYLAHAGIASRRMADQYISEGKVKVNGVVVTTLGTEVTRQDTIEYNGKVVKIERRIYVLLNKPKNFVTTTEDPQERKTVMHLVKNACDERIYPVGRLDRNTTGVLLLTNDGDMMGKLLHPSYNKKKIYQVTLNRPVLPEHMQQIIDGIELSDGEIHADVISYVDENDLSVVGIEIHSGRNRIVRRIFEYFGYRILKLDRVYFAGLTKKNLQRGHWRYLSDEEVCRLRQGNYE